MSIHSNSRFSRRAFGLGTLGIAGTLLVQGCGEESPGGNGNGNGTTAYANKGMNYFFFVVQSEAIKRKCEELGYTFQTTDAEHDSSAQYNDINSFILQRPALLITDPIDSEGLAPLTERARNDNIPIGVIDTPITAGVVDFTIAFDNFRGGEMAAERIVELLIERYGRPEGIVLNGYGALSSSAWRARKEGFEAVIEQYPDIELISRPTEGDEATARSIAQATLAEHPDLDAAHAPSDSITRGIITSLRGAGRALPKDDPEHVILTSIDGEPQSIEWIREGLLDVEVSQDPVAYGEVCVEMLSEYTAHGEDIPLGEYHNDTYYWESAPIEESENGPSCVVPPFYIDESNADDERHWGNVVTEQWGMSQS